MIGGAPDARVQEALEDARDAFLKNVEERRLRLFRCCLQASVMQASPLAISFARKLDLKLDDILQVMSPPPFWPHPTGSLALPQIRWAFPSWSARRGSDDRMMWRVARSGGHVRRIDGGGDWVGWRVVANAVEIVARFGPGFLMTRRGTLRLWVPAGLPETVRMAMPGRPLAALVDHPFFAGEDLTVAAVEECSGGHVLRARTGQRGFAAPWPAQLAGVLITHGSASVAARYVRDV